MAIEDDLAYVEGLLEDHRGYAPDAFYRIVAETRRLEEENQRLSARLSSRTPDEVDQEFQRIVSADPKRYQEFLDWFTKWLKTGEL